MSNPMSGNAPRNHTNQGWFIFPWFVRDDERLIRQREIDELNHQIKIKKLKQELTKL